MVATLRRPPTWFWIVAVLLLLWNLIGAYACIQQFRLGAEAMGPATDYDRALYAALPVWYNWVFVAAEVTGVGGALALLARRGVAGPLFVLSLIAVVVQFGYYLLATDAVAHKGAGVAVFPAVIATIGVFEIGFAGVARRREWLAG